MRADAVQNLASLRAIRAMENSDGVTCENYSKLNVVGDNERGSEVEYGEVEAEAESSYDALQLTYIATKCYEVGMGAVSIVVDGSSSIQRTKRNRYAVCRASPYSM